MSFLLKETGELILLETGEKVITSPGFVEYKSRKKSDNGVNKVIEYRVFFTTIQYIDGRIGIAPQISRVQMDAGEKTILSSDDVPTKMYQDILLPYWSGCSQSTIQQYSLDGVIPHQIV